MQISPRALKGETVEVIAESYEIFQPSEVLGKMTLSTRNITTLPSIGEIDIFNSLKLLPGISGIGNGIGYLCKRRNPRSKLSYP